MKLFSSLFWKLFGAFLIPIVGTILIFGWKIETETRREFINELLEQLSAQAVLLGNLYERRITKGDIQLLSQEITSISEVTGQSIHIYNAEGHIIAGSDNPADETNDSDWLKNWSRERVAKGIDYHPFLKTEVVFVSKQINKQPEKARFVHVALPLNKIQTKLDRLRSNTIFSGLIGFITALLLATLIVRRITGSVRQMASVAKAMQEGDYSQTVTRIQRDELGVLGKALNSLCKELTKKIEAARESHERLEAILRGMVEGVVAADFDEHLLFWNAAAIRLLNTTPPQWETPTVSEFLRYPELLEMIKKVQTDSKTVQKEISVFYEQQERLLACHATPARLHSKQGVVLVLHDVTEERRLATVRRDFVANASHELKTPLTAIKGYIDTILSEPKLEEETRDRFLKQMEKNVGRLVALTEDLLSLSRIESQGAKLEIMPVDAVTLAEEAVTRHQPNANKKGVTIEFNVSGSGEDPLIAANANAVHEILDNLLDNAIKFTPEGGRVRVQVTEAKSKASFVVSDSGIGIPADEQERIFERFYQVDKSRTSTRRGTGLGLSIVRNLVQQMHGTIELESDSGAGATFCVVLPLAASRSKVFTES